MDGLLAAVATSAEAELERAIQRLLHPPALAILHAGLARGASAPCRIVFLGDSHTAGLRASVKARRYVDRVVAALGGATVDSPTAEFGPLDPSTGVQGYNAGRNSAFASDYAPPAVVASVAALEPVMVVHAVGANDFSNARPPDDFRADIESVVGQIDALLTAPAVHVLLHVHQRRDAGGAWPWADYGKALRDLARVDPARRLFIDASAPFAVLDCFGVDPYGLGDPDDCHLADAGHGLLAATILRHLGANIMPAVGDPILAADVVRAIITSTVTLATSSTTLQNVTGLSVPVVAGRIYLVQGVFYGSNAAGGTEDIKYGFSFPAGTLRGGFVGGTTGGVSSTSASDMTIPFFSFTSGSSAVGIGLSTSITMALFSGHYVCNTSGTFQVMAAQNVSGGNASSVAASSNLLLIG